jgi:hypothetical protein
VGVLTDNGGPGPGDLSDCVTWVDLLLTAALQWAKPVTVRWAKPTAPESGFEYYYHGAVQGSPNRYVHAQNVDAIGVMLLGALEPGRCLTKEVAVYSFQPLPGKAVPEVVLACLVRYVAEARRVPGWFGSEPEAVVGALDGRAVALLGAPEVPWGLSDADRD